MWRFALPKKHPIRYDSKDNDYEILSVRPETSDPQLVLKATPPRLLKSILSRARLSIDSQELGDKAVVAVQAPSGFGKTSLLGQWRREWLQRGAAVAWLSLDEQDEEVMFVKGLQVSMRVGIGRKGFGEGFEPGSGPDDDLTALTGWLVEVANMAMDVVLILDDAHALPEHTVRRALAYLLHNVPANLRVVVASRGRMPLPVADLAAHGKFVAVTADMLRFSLAETTSALAARFGSRIDPDACARLHDTTEGWPLGLQLAIAAIEKSPDPKEAARSLSGRHGDIERYFVDCLLAGLEPFLVEFLVRVAAVGTICPDLARVVTGREDSRELLARLHAETPILAEDEAGHWSRIHPLARKFLLARFSSLPQAEQDQIHLRAAAWLTEHGLFELAAQEAFAAHEDEAAFGLVERCLYDIALQGRMASVLEWADRLPSAEIERRPRLRLAVAWALSLGERHAEALTLVEPILSDPAQDPTYCCEAAAIASSAAYFADQMDRAQEILATWFADSGELPPLLAAIVANQFGTLALYQGNPEKTRYQCQRSPWRQRPGMDAVSGWTEWLVGFSYLWEGQMPLAEEALRAALPQAEVDIGRRSPTAVMLAVTLGAALWEMGRGEEASALLADRLDVLERLSPPEAIVLGYRTAARLAALGGQEQRAFDLLEELFAIGDLRGMPRIAGASLLEEVRMHAARGRGESCETLLKRIEVIFPDQGLERDRLTAGLTRLFVLLSRVYAAVAKQDWRAVLALSAEAEPIAERLRRGRETVEIKLLRAVARMHTGETADALMAEAVSLAESYGLKRLLVDVHPDVGAWRSRSRTVAAEERPAPAAAAPRDTSAPRVSPSALLTPKEREVLKLLARNMSNKQIALALDVGEETVKWHMKNLFGKLSAGTRKHVLDRAKMLGILDVG